MERNSLQERLLARGDDEISDEDEDEFDEEDEESSEVYISFACEDCDYRWEILIDEDDEDTDRVQYCPMCGSANTTQI